MVLRITWNKSSTNFCRVPCGEPSRTESAQAEESGEPRLQADERLPSSAQQPPLTSPKLPPLHCRERQQRRKEAPAVSGTEAREKLMNKAKRGGESDVLRATAGEGGGYRGESLQGDGMALNRRDCLVEGDCWLPAAVFSRTGARRRGLLSSKRKFSKCGKNTGTAWQSAWAVP